MKIVKFEMHEFKVQISEFQCPWKFPFLKASGNLLKCFCQAFLGPFCSLPWMVSRPFAKGFRSNFKLYSFTFNWKFNSSPTLSDAFWKPSGNPPWTFLVVLLDRLEPSGSFLGAFWELSRSRLGTSGSLLGASGRSWELSESLLKAFWKLSGSFWEACFWKLSWKPSESFLEAFWKPSESLLKAFWELLGRFWKPSGSFWELSGSLLGAYWEALWKLCQL